MWISGLPTVVCALLLGGWALCSDAHAQGPKKVPQHLNVGSILTGNDPVDKTRAGCPHQRHAYFMTAGTTYVVQMTTNDLTLDPYLRIEDAAGKNLAEDDDSGGKPNARIIFKAQHAGNYTIIATTKEPKQSGYYQLV